MILGRKDQIPYTVGVRWISQDQYRFCCCFAYSCQPLHIVVLPDIFLQEFFLWSLFFQRLYDHWGRYEIIKTQNSRGYPFV